MTSIASNPRGLDATPMPAPSLSDFAVTSVEKLRFADTDRSGHITNAVFAACCQNARMELLCDPQRVPVPPNTQFVIAKLVLEFRSEMHWPGTVEVGTRVEWISRSSIMLAQGLFAEQRCIVIAESVVALVDTSTRRSMHLPVATVDALRSLSPPGRKTGVMPAFISTADEASAMSRVVGRRTAAPAVPAPNIIVVAETSRRRPSAKSTEAR